MLRRSKLPKPGDKKIVKKFAIAPRIYIKDEERVFFWLRWFYSTYEYQDIGYPFFVFDIYEWKLIDVSFKPPKERPKLKVVK